MDHQCVTKYSTNNRCVTKYSNDNQCVTKYTHNYDNVLIQTFTKASNILLSQNW